MSLMHLENHKRREINLEADARAIVKSKFEGKRKLLSTVRK